MADVFINFATMENPLNNFALSMFAYAAQREMDVISLANLSGINLSELQSANAQALSKAQINEMWLHAVSLSRDDMFGLHFGESLQLAALGVVGQIIKSSATIGDALKTAASFTPVLTDLFSTDVSKTDDAIIINFKPQVDDWQRDMISAQTIQFLMVFVIHELDGLVLKKINPKEVQYAGKINGTAEFERVVRCKINFGGKSNYIKLDPGYWDTTIITSNYQIQQILLEKNISLKVLLNGKTTLRERIVNYLATNSYLGMASLEQVARNFNTGTRTLQRQLKEEGVSFQQITDDVRKTLALEYLNAGKHPLKEISDMLGYNELSAFVRTFKRWTGTTPAYYRQSL